MKKWEETEFTKALCKLGICAVLTMTLLLGSKTGAWDRDNVRQKISQNSFPSPERLWEKTVALWKEIRQSDK